MIKLRLKPQGHGDNIIDFMPNEDGIRKNWPRGIHFADKIMVRKKFNKWILKNLKENLVVNLWKELLDGLWIDKKYRKFQISHQGVRQKYGQWMGDCRMTISRQMKHKRYPGSFVGWAEEGKTLPGIGV